MQALKRGRRASTPAHRTEAEQLLNIHEAAEYLRCSPKTLRRRYQAGRIGASRESHNSPLKFKFSELKALYEDGYVSGSEMHQRRYALPLSHITRWESETWT